MEELNVCELELSMDSTEVALSLSLNFKALGPRVGKRMQKLQAAVKELSQDQLSRFEAEAQIEIEGFVLTAEDATLGRVLAGPPKPNVAVHGDR
ncbi:hypothetical protein Emag_002292 [Eimeria magna]